MTTASYGVIPVAGFQDFQSEGALRAPCALILNLKIATYYDIIGLMERLRDGETVIIAEGYLFVFERRGYLTAGSFVPEVVLEHPELVRQQYEEFVHAGSDVVQAFTVIEMFVQGSD